MFNFLNRKKNDVSSTAFRREMACRYNGIFIKYADERIDDQEIVIGKAGSISVRGGELIVLSSSKIIFRSIVDETDFSPLMSGDGVIVSGCDIENGGNFRKITLHFTSYIK